MINDNLFRTNIKLILPDQEMALNIVKLCFIHKYPDLQSVYEWQPYTWTGSSLYFCHANKAH